MKQPPSLLEDIFCVVRDIQANIEQEKQFGYWQLCPKCHGEVTIPRSGLSDTGFRTCPVCNGNKILARPLINDQK